MKKTAKKIKRVSQRKKPAARPVPTDLIISIGAEGGSLAVYGHKDSAGEWVFEAERDESGLGDLLEESDRDAALAIAHYTLATWADVLRWLDRYPWTRLSPLEIHPDFRRPIWIAILARSQTLALEDLRAWLRSVEAWARLCLSPAYQLPML